MSSDAADADEPTINSPNPTGNIPLENALVGKGIDVNSLLVSPTGGASVDYASDADDFELPVIVRVFSEAVDAIDGPIVATVVDPETDEVRAEYAMKAGWLRQYRGDQISSRELISRILALDSVTIENLFEDAFEGTGIAFYNHLDRRLQRFGCVLTELEQETENATRMNVRVTPQALETEATTNRGPVAACLPVILHYFASLGVQFKISYYVVVEHVDGTPVDRVEIPAEETWAYHVAMGDEDRDDLSAFFKALRAAIESADTISLEYVDSYRDRVRETSAAIPRPAELEPVTQPSGGPTA